MLKFIRPCDQVQHPLAAGFVCRADGGFHTFAEPSVSSGFGSVGRWGAFEGETPWMIELLGDVASATLTKWLQENPDGLLGLSSGTKDKQLRQAAEKGRGLRVERLLAN